MQQMREAFVIGAGEQAAFSESHLGSVVSVALSLGAPTLSLGDS